MRRNIIVLTVICISFALASCTTAPYKVSSTYDCETGKRTERICEDTHTIIPAYLGVAAGAVHVKKQNCKDVIVEPGKKAEPDGPPVQK